MKITHYQLSIQISSFIFLAWRPRPLTDWCRVVLLQGVPVHDADLPLAPCMRASSNSSSNSASTPGRYRIVCRCHSSSLAATSLASPDSRALPAHPGILPRQRHYPTEHRRLLVALDIDGPLRAIDIDNQRPMGTGRRLKFYQQAVRSDDGPIPLVNG